MYEIEAVDFYQDIKKDAKKRFDTSSFKEKQESGLKIGENEKVVGKFKFEVCGKEIVQFVGLRSKLYSFKVEGGKEERKYKGIKKNVVKKEITFEDYKNTLFSEKEEMREMNLTRSDKNDIFFNQSQQDSIIC